MFVVLCYNEYLVGAVSWKGATLLQVSLYLEFVTSYRMVTRELEKWGNTMLKIMDANETKAPDGQANCNYN